MLYQHLAIYFLKAEYIIQVMNSAVKDKWKSTNQQQQLPVVDMFVNRSGRIEQPL
jgi:hypothetical protein